MGWSAHGLLREDLFLASLSKSMVFPLPSSPLVAFPQIFREPPDRLLRQRVNSAVRTGCIATICSKASKRLTRVRGSARPIPSHYTSCSSSQTGCPVLLLVSAYHRSETAQPVLWITTLCGSRCIPAASLQPSLHCLSCFLRRRFLPRSDFRSTWNFCSLLI